MQYIDTENTEGIQYPTTHTYIWLICSMSVQRIQNLQKNNKKNKIK